MLESYRTLQKDGIHEIEIKKSRFICHLYRIDCEESAKEKIAAIKKEHWKASHNCSAYLLGEQYEIQRSSDDGEPSGTAGIPMLEVLKKKELHDVLAVVTRYFGGTKLGAGGLIRAYGQSVSEALNVIGIVERKLQQEIFLKIDYPQLGKVEHFIETSTYTIQKIDYTDTVLVTILANKEDVQICQDSLIQLLSNNCQLKIGNFSYHDQLITD